MSLAYPKRGTIITLLVICLLLIYSGGFAFWYAHLIGLNTVVTLANLLKCNLAKAYVKQVENNLRRRAPATVVDQRDETASVRDCDLDDSDITRRLTCRKVKIEERIKCHEIEFKNKFVSFWKMRDIAVNHRFMKYRVMTEQLDWW